MGSDVNYLSEGRKIAFPHPLGLVSLSYIFVYSIILVQFLALLLNSAFRY